MKSVLYCGCTVNAYMPRRAFSFSPRPNLPLSPRLLSFSLRLVVHDVAICAISRSLAAGSANESARRRAFTAFLRHGGGCGRLGLLPPAFLLFQPPRPTPPATTPGAQPSPSSRLRLPPVHRPVGGTTPSRVYFLLVVLLPVPGPARKRAPDCLLRHCA